MASRPRPLVGLFAGVAAGLVASAAMAAFQKLTRPLVEPGAGDPATVKAADAVSELVIGDPVPQPWREESGEVVHYLVGATLGGIYGLLAEYDPDTRAGFGAAYGVAVSALLDETVVPVAGLAPSPEETPVATHVQGVASHLVYGMVLEGVRTLIAGRR